MSKSSDGLSNAKYCRNIISPNPPQIPKNGALLTHISVGCQSRSNAFGARRSHFLNPGRRFLFLFFSARLLPRFRMRPAARKRVPAFGFRPIGGIFFLRERPVSRLRRSIRALDALSPRGRYGLRAPAFCGAAANAPARAPYFAPAPLNTGFGRPIAPRAIRALGSGFLRRCRKCACAAAAKIGIRSPKTLDNRCFFFSATRVRSQPSGLLLCISPNRQKSPVFPPFPMQKAENP